MNHRLLFFLGIICSVAVRGYAQNPGGRIPDKTALPVLNLERRGDDRYVDSLTQLGLSLLGRVQLLPRSDRNDTLRLYALNHLATIYRTKRGRVDSSLYYANQLITLARTVRNVKYQVKGFLAAEYYHHYSQTNFPDALAINYAALELIQKTKKEPHEAWRFYLRLGDIYTLTDDVPRAFDNLEKALAGFRRFPNTRPFPILYEANIVQSLGLLHKKMGQFDKAERFLTEAFELVKGNPNYRTNQIYLSSDLGDLYTENGQLEKGLAAYRIAEKYQTELALMNGLTNTWGLMALAEVRLKNHKAAVDLAQKVLKGRSMKMSRRKAYQALYQVYEAEKDWEKAYYFHARYMAIRDTLEADRQVSETERLTRAWELEKLALQNEQEALLRDSRLSALTKQRQIERLRDAIVQEQLVERNRKNELERQNEFRFLQSKVEQERIAQKNRIDLLNLTMENERKLRLLLVGFLSLLLVLILVLLIQNVRIRKQQKLISGLNANLENRIVERTTELQTALQEQASFQAKEAEFQQRIAETEMSALRAQMNPHFIFNCLNSIQFFTAQNDAEKASDYLTKFSRLIRLVLENSKSEKVTLENELETLRLYMDMEAMRFQQKVRYDVRVNPVIDTVSIQIPPLLLQPFVENAIWHGLMHKNEGGTVWIDVQQIQDDLLRIEITDDGVGRQRAADYKSKSATRNKSFGMKLTADRIALINQLYHTQTQVEVLDLVDGNGIPNGTQVIIKIPI